MRSRCGTRWRQRSSRDRSKRSASPWRPDSWPPCSSGDRNRPLQRVLVRRELAVALRLLGQLDPGLSHVDQCGLGAGFMRVVGQPKALQCVLAIVIVSVHGVASAASMQSCTRNSDSGNLFRAMPQRCEGFPEMPEAVAGVRRIGQVGLLAAQQSFRCLACLRRRLSRAVVSGPSHPMAVELMASIICGQRFRIPTRDLTRLCCATGAK